ncbi:UDP-N-acetylmuramoyl-L-alanine--D-glutamate ligase [Candidatus Saccharibacteria bacterium]|nr:UDP-N-acetylmuramoyl-L-alanine--D-glutamate ligase [Candidatus Saccharibacteria bacterium]
MLKLAILGYGVEGKSVENYFKTHPYENVDPKDIEIKIFDQFEDSEIDSFGLENFDVVFRTPSVRPHYDFKEFEADESFGGTEKNYLKNKPYWTSATKYFFEHCPAEIIAVTGTKGKGTTCSMIANLLDSMNQKIYDKDSRPRAFLIGNIGLSPLDVLDQITEHDNVIFEISSFQLWDLHTSPAVSVILRIEPDHLNVHKDFEEYTYAKSTLTRYQSENDFLVYYSENPVTAAIAKTSRAHKISYPIKNPSAKLTAILDSLTIPGEHNRENAEAALLAVAARFFGGDLDQMLESEVYGALATGMKNFKGLPHRIEFIRNLNGVEYYDDNYSSALPALDVALKTFENYPTVLIAGGFDRKIKNGAKDRIFSAKNLEKAILIGETAKQLAEGEPESRYEFAETLEDAVSKAKAAAEAAAKKSGKSIVLMSPGFPSFDMFKNFTDRGEKFTKIVKELK